MYMGRIGASPENEIVRELRGARILITGLSKTTGVDVARAFADLKALLVIHTTDLSPEITALVALLSQSAGEIKLYTDPIASPDAAVRFAQTAAQAYGGLDAVINLSSILSEDMRGIATEQDVTDLLTQKLTPLAHLTSVTANRMRVVQSEGLILNVLSMPRPASSREAAVATYARAALASMTKTEALTWAAHGIRVNSVGPSVVSEAQDQDHACLSSEPDIAALAIYLASRRGKSLAGHVFDAGGTPRRGD